MSSSPEFSTRHESDDNLSEGIIGALSAQNSPEAARAPDVVSNLAITRCVAATNIPSIQ